MFLLIDCDNFFVSCERIFQPQYKNRPVVVLSNNDGCVVSRSYEAKSLNIPMCTPYFKVRTLLQAHNGVALSSNYELYADISRRIMTLLRQEFSSIEIYSIDEAFARVFQNCDYTRLALHVRRRILQEIGVSVSIGIAPTKTLCKIAGSIAKKKKTDKVQLLSTPDEIDEALKQIDVIDIWGVGRHLNSKLNFLGIFTAYELKQAPLKMIRKSFSINLEKTVMELNSYPCLEIEAEDISQSLVTSRTFEHNINNFDRLETIISEFVDSACLRLREQNATARAIIVFLKTNRFDTQHQQYNNSAFVSLNYPCNHTGKFIQAMKKGLQQIFRSEYSYKSAGVILSGIAPVNTPNIELFSDIQPRPREQKLMHAFDFINHKLGKKSLFFGTQAPGVNHYIKREFRSSSYTTSWDGLAVVR